MTCNFPFIFDSRSIAKIVDEGDIIPIFKVAMATLSAIEIWDN